MVDRPLIQHVVDEARAAGIEHLIFVTGRNKGVIEDHFDLQYELEQTLAARGKKPELVGAGRGAAGGGRDLVHAPAGTAWTGPRGVVRTRTGRTRAVRRVAPGCTGPGEAKLHRADGRGLSPGWRGREHHRGRGGAEGSSVFLRRGRRRRAQGQVVPHHRHGREAEARGCAVQPHHHGTLHPAAGNFRPARDAAEGRGRRNPVDRRAVAIAGDAARLRLPVRRPHLRLRLQARLPVGQRRLCARARRHRAGVAQGS